MKSQPVRRRVTGKQAERTIVAADRYSGKFHAAEPEAPAPKEHDAPKDDEAAKDALGRVREQLRSKELFNLLVELFGESAYHTILAVAHAWLARCEPGISCRIGSEGALSAALVMTGINFEGVVPLSRCVPIDFVVEHFRVTKTETVRWQTLLCNIYHA